MRPSLSGVFVVLAMTSCQTSSPRSVRARNAADCQGLQGIQGVLRDRDGSPIRGGVLVAKWYSKWTEFFFGDRETSWSPAPQGTRTDANGGFSIQCLELGTYRLSAWFCDMVYPLDTVQPSNQNLELHVPVKRQSVETDNDNCRGP